MRESQWTRKICKELEACGVRCFPNVAGARTPRGRPDRHIVTAFGTFELEFKASNGKLTAIQRHVMQLMNAVRPGAAFVVRMPGWIENEDGEDVESFDGTGAGLLAALRRLSVNTGDLT